MTEAESRALNRHMKWLAWKDVWAGRPPKSPNELDAIIKSFLAKYRQDRDSSLKKKVKNVFCRIGWHGARTNTFHDGASQHAKCNSCGYEGMIDSQGNMF